MRWHGLLIAVIAAMSGWVAPEVAPAAVVVLANRTDAKVEFLTLRADGKVSRHSLEPTHVLPIPVEHKVAIAFDATGAPRRSMLDADTVHYFLMRDKRLELVRVGLGDGSGAAAVAPQGSEELADVHRIPVMLLADEDQPATRRVWESRYRKRLEAASDVFQQHCRVRFEVVKVGIWKSDDTIDDFAKSLREFELLVDPAPARVAVGFTSQYKFPRGQVHLGGTRGPMHPHILIREWSQHITESERLEVLVHELAHLLGAVHSPEQTSVMRPILGDRLSRSRDFRIGFDAVNTLAMYLIGEQLRSGKFRGFGRMRADRKARLAEIYTTFSKLTPNDPTAKRYLELLSPEPSK